MRGFILIKELIYICGDESLRGASMAMEGTKAARARLSDERAFIRGEETGTGLAESYRRRGLGMEAAFMDLIGSYVESALRNGSPDAWAKSAHFVGMSEALRDLDGCPKSEVVPFYRAAYTYTRRMLRLSRSGAETSFLGRYVSPQPIPYDLLCVGKPRQLRREARELQRGLDSWVARRGLGGSPEIRLIRDRFSLIRA